MVGFDKLPCNEYCYICGTRLDKSNATRDHFIAKSRGGSHDISNLRPACRECNFAKKSTMPSVTLSVMLYTFKHLRNLRNLAVSRIDMNEVDLFDTYSECYAIKISYRESSSIIYFCESAGSVELLYTNSSEDKDMLLAYISYLARRALAHRAYYTRLARGAWPIKYWGTSNSKKGGSHMSDCDVKVTPLAEPCITRPPIEDTIKALNALNSTKPDATSTKDETDLKFCEICGAEIGFSHEQKENNTHSVCRDCIDYILDNSLLPVSVLRLLRERREHLICEDRLIQLQQQNEVLLQKLSDMQEIVKSLNTQFESVLPSNL